MEFVHLQAYNQKTIGNLLKSPSGLFHDAEGNVVTVESLMSKVDYLKMVKEGKITATTKPEQAIKSLKLEGQDFDNGAGTKSPELVDNFDHIVISNIPSNYDVQKYLEIIVREFENADVFYSESGKNYLAIGKREVIARVDNASGNNHIHLVVGRHAIVDKETLFQKLAKIDTDDTLNDNERVECRNVVNKALGYMSLSGKDKALTQATQIDKAYFQNKMGRRINSALIANGLAPLPEFGSFGVQRGSNKPSTNESKKATNELANEGYTEEAVEKVYRDVAEAPVSAIDSVIIQAKLDTNKSKMQQLRDEMERLASESRQLTQAQQAMQEAVVLKTENENLKKQVEALDSSIRTKEEVLTRRDEEYQNLHKELVDAKLGIESLKEDIQQKQELISSINEDYKNVEEELKTITVERDTLAKTNEELNHSVLNKEETLKTRDEENKALKSKNEQLEFDLSASIEKIERVEKRATTAESTIETLNETIADMRQQHREALEVLKAENKQLKADNEKLSVDLEVATSAIVPLEQLNEQLSNDNQKYAVDMQNLKSENQKLKADNAEKQVEIEASKEERTALQEQINRLVDIAVRLKDFGNTVVKTLKETLKSTPKLKADVAPLIKEHTAISKSDALKAFDALVKSTAIEPKKPAPDGDTPPDDTTPKNAIKPK